MFSILKIAVLPIAAALLCASCGVSTEYSESSKPSAPYQAVVVGDFKYKVEDPTADGAKLSNEFPSVLSEEFQNGKRFQKITGKSYKGRALRVEGDVTLLAEGNSALRIGVGMGAGKSHFYTTARFIDNSTGKLLGTYTVERSSKNGMMGIADNFPVVRRSAAYDIATKAADFAPAN